MTEEEEEAAEAERRRKRRRRLVIIILDNEQRTENDVIETIREITTSTSGWVVEQRSATPAQPATTTEADVQRAFADLLGAVAPDERQQILGSRKRSLTEQYSQRRAQLIDSLMAGRVTA